MTYSSPDGGKSISTVKVGPKGQIVIPKDIRDLFGIQPGDSLLLLADKEKGIALQLMSFFSGIADMIFEGRGKEIYPDQPPEHSVNFAEAIRKAEADSKEIQEDEDD